MDEKESRYREAMKRFVSLVLESKAALAEFSKEADMEGLKEGADTLSSMEKDEVSTLSRYGRYGSTVHNLRLLLDRQVSKCKAVSDLMSMASEEGDTEAAADFRLQLMEEKRKAERLQKSLEFHEKNAERIKRLRKQEEERRRAQQKERKAAEQAKAEEKYVPPDMIETDMTYWY
jgi:hypothetical protein